MSGKMCSLRSSPQPNMSRVSSAVVYLRPTQICRRAAKARTIRRRRPGDDIARARKRRGGGDFNQLTESLTQKVVASRQMA
jgi:hypothetical protein